MSFIYDGYENPDSCLSFFTVGLSGEGYLSVSSMSSTSLIPNVSK